jgi:signal transduction histidine kinase
LVEHQLAGKKIRLQKSLAASPDVVWGDSYQLEQALLNLFFNASEATGANGELSIATELVIPAPPSCGGPSGTQIRLSIKDSGIGIPPENIPRLFDPFFTTKKKGNGLGLSITRRIIQEHNGTISVASALNQGTTFTILLPCLDA